MILPSKHLPQNRALLTVGAQVLAFLTLPKTVSSLWEELSHHGAVPVEGPQSITYDWFLLALALLYALGSIDLQEGIVTRRAA